MTSPLGEKGLEAARDALRAEGVYLGRSTAANLIRAYLSATALPDGMEVAIKRAVARLQNLHDYAGSPTWERVLEEELGAIFSQAQSALAAMRVERDEAIDRAKVWEHYWSQEVKVKGEVIGWCKNYQARIKALEEALGPLADKPDDWTVDQVNAARLLLKEDGE